MSFEEHTILEPLWIRCLVEEAVREAVCPLGFIGPLGYRYWEPGDPDNSFDGWQLMVFPTPNEVRGPSAHDGRKYVSGFRLDVSRIMSSMASVDAVVWNSPTQYNGDLDGPEVSVQGTFLGKRVRLRFFQLPPPDEPCTFYVDPSTGRAVERHA